VKYLRITTGVGGFMTVYSVLAAVAKREELTDSGKMPKVNSSKKSISLISSRVSEMLRCS
jgi:hypothetical protein